MEPLDQNGCQKLAAALGETPETAISVHLLRRGLAEAFVVAPPGWPDRFRAAVIRPRADPTEPVGFGEDAEALWSLLAPLPGWRCVNVAPGPAAALAAAMAVGLDRAIRRYGDVYHIAPDPVPAIDRPEVRRLTPADVALLEAAPPELAGAAWGFGSAASLLVDGFAAGAVADGQLVAVAYTGARSQEYADIGVATLAPWRGSGWATAAASAVARAIQAAGQRPIWSAGEGNASSLAIARKLGFVEVSRRWYLIPEVEEARKRGVSLLLDPSTSRLLASVYAGGWMSTGSS